ncbi:MAG: hypothetical protein AAF609_26955 [Cyanobacteria bacterium P01_C01_bin.120]
MSDLTSTRLLKPHLAQRFAVLIGSLSQASNPFLTQHNSSFQDDTFMTMQIMTFLRAMVATAQPVREEIHATSH